MIAVHGIHARAGASGARPASQLTNVSFTWERGVLAVLGSPVDGTTSLLEVLAGSSNVRVRGGSALVNGRPPELARAHTFHVPLEPALPDALRVEEVCLLAGGIRGEPAMTPASRLAPLGLEKLADRRVRSLSPGELRAVSLSIALTSQASVLLIEEPLAGLDPAAPARVVEAVRARATAGAAIVVTTASVRDATSLADQLGLLTRGVYTHLPPALAHSGAGAGGAKLRVVVTATDRTEVAPFVAALTEEAAVASVETAAYAATRVLHAAVAVVVSGPDLLGLARAIGAAAARTAAAVEAIESAVMPLDAIRARMAPQPPPQPPQPLQPPQPPQAAGSQAPPRGGV